MQRGDQQLGCEGVLLTVFLGGLMGALLSPILDSRSLLVLGFAAVGATGLLTALILSGHAGELTLPFQFLLLTLLIIFADACSDTLGWKWWQAIPLDVTALAVGYVCAFWLPQRFASAHPTPSDLDASRAHLSD